MEQTPAKTAAQVVMSQIENITSEWHKGVHEVTIDQATCDEYYRIIKSLKNSHTEILEIDN